MARIYIVDDDPDIRRVVTYALADQGHVVWAARDAETALQTILDEAPELVVLDVMMPGMDGFELLHKLEELGVRKAFKVLILTAKGSERDWEEGFANGADMYMTKPFDPEELSERIEVLLNSTDAELAAFREREKDRAHLLSQLEDLLGDV